MINIYVGWDAREVEAYDVCVASLKRHATIPINIIPLKRSELIDCGLYTREHDALAATEFTYTRFFIPFLNNYEGISIFCDCDFLWLEDIKKLLEELNYMSNSFYNKAVYVAKHDYTPKNKIKMDGIVQTVYPRKNWSSLIVWNCAHPKHQILDKDCLNTSTGAFLHRFQWLDDTEIGSIDVKWNWLVDTYDVQSHNMPLALHYTEGGPWFENYRNCSFSDLWYKEKDILLHKP